MAWFLQWDPVAVVAVLRGNVDSQIVKNSVNLDYTAGCALKNLALLPSRRYFGLWNFSI